MLFWPSAWVFPGGHIEVDEGLDEGSLREFYEETGVQVKMDKIKDSPERRYSYAGQEITVTPFYAFESQLESDPQQLEKAPRVAHLVIFFKCKLPVTCAEISL